MTNTFTVNHFNISLGIEKIWFYVCKGLRYLHDINGLIMKMIFVLLSLLSYSKSQEKDAFIKQHKSTTQNLKLNT